jgi:hypothetical protein
MFFLWPLQMAFDDCDDDVKFQSSRSVRTVVYKRDDRSTKSLERFLKMLEIVRHLAQIFGESQYMSMLIIDKNKGFFCVPQLKSFIDHTSRHLSNTDIARLPSIINGDKRFEKAVSALGRLGSELGCLYRMQTSDDDSAKRKREGEAEREVALEGRKRRMQKPS